MEVIECKNKIIKKLNNEDYLVDINNSGIPDVWINKNKLFEALVYLQLVYNEDIEFMLITYDILNYCGVYKGYEGNYIPW